MITKALIQEKDSNTIDTESVLVKEALLHKNIFYSLFTKKQMLRRRLSLDKSTLVVGDIDVIYSALKQLSIDIPIVNDYPVELNHMLHRRIWSSTLGTLMDSFYNGRHISIFVKPMERLKRFTGFIASSHEDYYKTRGASKRTLVTCSEVVEWLSEWRVYVVHSKIVKISKCPKSGDAEIDKKVVEEAVSLMGETLHGYAIDFGVLSTGETALIEMNDGFSIGAYDIDPIAYTDMIIARWEQLMMSI